MRRIAFALLVAAVGAAAAPATDTKTFDLDGPFGEVEACLPFNLAIDAGNATAPALIVTAEQAVLDAIRVNVSANGTLSLGAAPFSTSAPIKATLRVPADALTRVVTASPGGSVVLATGLAPAGGQLTLAAYGGAELQARSLIVTTLNASANGAATLVAQGAITGADVAAVGGSRVYVGLTDAADVRARGAARVFIAPAASNATITGTVGGPAASVTTTKGACDLEWAGAGAGARTAPRCVRTSITLPPTTTKLWTCGVALVGKAGASCDAGFGTVVTGDGGPMFPWADDDASFPATNNPAWNQVNSMMNAMMGGGPGPGMMNGAFAGAGPAGAFAGPFGGRKLAGAASFASSSGDGASSYMSSTTDFNGKTTIVTGGSKRGGAGGAVVTGRDGATIYTSDGSPSSSTGATFVSSGGRGAATVINNNGRVTYVSDDDSAGAPAPTVVAAPRCAVADKDRRMVNA